MLSIFAIRMKIKEMNPERIIKVKIKNSKSLLMFMRFIYDKETYRSGEQPTLARFQRLDL